MNTDKNNNESSDSEKVAWIRGIASSPKVETHIKAIIMHIVADDKEQSDVVRDYARFHGDNCIERMKGKE